VTVVPNPGGAVNYIAPILTSVGGTATGLVWDTASASGSVNYCAAPTCTVIKPLATGQNLPGQIGVSGVGGTVDWWASQGAGTLTYNSEPNPLTPPGVIWLSGLSNPFGVAIVSSTNTIFFSNTATVQMTTGSTQSSSPWMTGFASAGMLAVDATYLYATDTTGGGRVLSCSQSGACGAAPSVNAYNLAQPAGKGPAGIFADGTNLWFTVPGSGGAGGAVYRCPSGTANCGSPPVAFWSPSPNATGIVSDVARGTVYWVVAPTGIYSCPISGCPTAGPTLVVSGVAAGGGNALAQDATLLFFADTSGGISQVAK
jgi:hypothetical protein